LTYKAAAHLLCEKRYFVLGTGEVFDLFKIFALHNDFDGI